MCFHGACRLARSAQGVKRLRTDKMKWRIYPAEHSQPLQSFQCTLRLAGSHLSNRQREQRSPVVGGKKITCGKKHRRLVWQAMAQVDVTEQIHQLNL